MESDESISMLEKTSVRLMPILNQVVSKMVKEKESTHAQKENKSSILKSSEET